MKKSLCLAASLLALYLTPVFGQPQLSYVWQAGTSQTGATNLTKFNLDFPGGTPQELVAAIQKATGKPLNAIIPPEDADLQLPPLKMNNIDSPQLFVALEEASVKTIAVFSPGRGYSTFNGSYGFKTADSLLSDTSIWYFRAEKPNVPPLVSDQKICQFYSLSPYLDRGFTVDDITTAIQTGWKMAGINPTPDLNYHKETKLLIAYGEPDKLKTIDDVLKTLPQSNVQVAEAKMYWNYIQGLQGQIDELKKKINAQNSSTNATPAENIGK